MLNGQRDQNANELAINMDICQDEEKCAFEEMAIKMPDSLHTIFTRMGIYSINLDKLQ